MIHQKALIAYIRNQFLLDWHGIHGIRHWARVLSNGLRIAERESGVRTDVVRLFSLLHDHVRVNEGIDPEHGLRACHAAHHLRGKFFDIDNRGFALLCDAMTYHSDGMTQGDITVQACWDADRLDLGRVGTMPLARYLCTKTAKDPAFIAEAFERSIT